MEWLERNNIKVDEITGLGVCNYCNEDKFIEIRLTFKDGKKEYFCSNEHLKKYCAQMKDMVI